MNLEENKISLHQELHLAVNPAYAALCKQPLKAAVVAAVQSLTLAAHPLAAPPAAAAAAAVIASPAAQPQQLIVMVHLRPGRFLLWLVQQQPKSNEQDRWLGALVHITCLASSSALSRACCCIRSTCRAPQP